MFLTRTPRTLFQSDLLASFIDNEIAKKQEKERMKTDRIRRRDGAKKRTLEEEMDEDTKVEETRLDPGSFFPQPRLVGH